MKIRIELIAPWDVQRIVEVEFNNIGIAQEIYDWLLRRLLTRTLKRAGKEGEGWKITKALI